MKRKNKIPLGRGNAAVLLSGSNTAKVSVRAERGEFCLVQLESNPDERRVVHRSDLKPRKSPCVLFVQAQP
jgi:hypothetical protein